MKKMIVLIIGMLMLTGTLFAAPFVAEQEAGDTKIKVSMDSNPPATGENELNIIISDAEGKAVEDAKIKVNYTMPSIGNMPPMSYKARAKYKGESYMAKVNLSMPGKWGFAIAVKMPGKDMTKVEFNVTVQ